MKVLVLGVGNILLSDDGVGVWVIQELNGRFIIPPNVELYDGGTGGLSLLPVIVNADYLLIIDSVLVGEEPGTIVKFYYEDIPPNLQRKISSHEIDVIELLRIAEALEKRPPTTIIGIQPENVSLYGTEILIKDRIPDLITAVVNELRCLGIELKPKRNEPEPV